VKEDWWQPLSGQLWRKYRRIQAGETVASWQPAYHLRRRGYLESLARCLLPANTFNHELLWLITTHNEN